jgi:hypothetical protein
MMMSPVVARAGLSGIATPEQTSATTPTPAKALPSTLPTPQADLPTRPLWEWDISGMDQTSPIELKAIPSRVSPSSDDPPTPIQLPPAAWTGLATLGAMGLAKITSRLRRRSA